MLEATPTQPRRQALDRILEAHQSRATSLDISFLGITSLPPELFHLTRLVSLNMANNALVTLPPEIEKLPNLRMLNATNNPLGTLPDQLYNLTELQSLRLGGSRRHLPISPKIGQLNQLKQLYWWSNKLNGLPPQIGHLTQLQQLYLFDNQINALPPQIGHLGDLNTLDLGYNLLTVLPPQIGKLTSLSTLNLRDNQIIRLPAELRFLPNLETLHLENNPLHFPPNLGGKAEIKKALSAYFEFNPPTVQSTRVFLAYARKDIEEVEKVYQTLRNVGHKVWMDIHDTEPGQDPTLAARQGLEKTRILVVCLSNESVEPRGGMQGELLKTFELLDESRPKNLIVIPIRLNRCPNAERLGSLPTLDWFEPSGPERLLNAIQNILRRAII